MIATTSHQASSRGRASWHIVTGEFPPQPGGVSDYCSLLTAALAAAGEEVHVWTPPSPPGGPRLDGVKLHRLSSRFGPGSLRELSAGLEASPPPRRLFIQYVADSFGCHAMNLPFCLWISRRRAESVWVLFHEYAYHVAWGERLMHNVRGVVTSAMGALVASRADRIFVSTPAWERRIPARVRAARSIAWLPTPSNVPPLFDEESVRAARQMATGGESITVIGHFGTFGLHIARLLAEALHPLLLGRPDRRCLLIGRGGNAFAKELSRRHPTMSSQLVTTGGLPTESIARYIRACDIMLQPYEEGATSRRGTLMAGLSLGVPVVTNLGHSSEAIWSESGAVALAEDARPESIAAAAESLLSSPARWQDLGRRAAAIYVERFSLERTLETLQRLAREDDERLR
jgi:glycosyltransferase involved in cell wall biosynthesis